VPRPGRDDDEELLRASIVHLSPSQLDVALHDRRPWVRKIAETEADRRAEQDDEVVCREPLHHIVTVFVARWNRDRPPMGGQWAGADRARSAAAHVSALEYLSENSGVPRGTIENLTRSKARSPVVPYDVADALVAAIGCTDVMFDGTLEPTSRRDGGSCCSGSGSLTG
jgi:hypothetical protein